LLFQQGIFKNLNPQFNMDTMSEHTMSSYMDCDMDVDAIPAYPAITMDWAEPLGFLYQGDNPASVNASAASSVPFNYDDSDRSWVNLLSNAGPELEHPFLEPQGSLDVLPQYDPFSSGVELDPGNLTLADLSTPRYVPSFRVAGYDPFRGYAEQNDILEWDLVPSQQHKEQTQTFLQDLQSGVAARDDPWAAIDPRVQGYHQGQIAFPEFPSTPRPTNAVLNAAEPRNSFGEGSLTTPEVSESEILRDDNEREPNHGTVPTFVAFSLCPAATAINSRGGRRGPLSEDGRKHAKVKRIQGACFWCRVKKIKVCLGG
jgi:hypothetical protein